MTAGTDPIPGVSVDVDDLVRVRGQLSGISLKSLKRRSSFRSGAREIRMRGRGMEYEESRAYVSGDDMRTMDWRVMARTGEAHTKIFAEEKERRYLLAIDLSSSMFFGTRYSFKSWAACFTAAHLGWLASEAGDRLGGLIVAPNVHYEVRPGKTRTSLLALFHHLAEISGSPQPEPDQSRLGFLLQELHRVVKPGSIINLISDFVGIDQHSAEHLSLLTKHNDVNAFWIFDDIEREPWQPGQYPVRFPETVVDLNLASSNTRSWLHEQQSGHRDRIETLMAGLNIPLFALSCNDPLTQQIARHLGF